MANENVENLYTKTMSRSRNKNKSRRGVRVGKVGGIGGELGAGAATADGTLPLYWLQGCHRRRLLLFSWPKQAVGDGGPQDQGWTEKGEIVVTRCRPKCILR